MKFIPVKFPLLADLWKLIKKCYNFFNSEKFPSVKAFCLPHCFSNWKSLIIVFVQFLITFIAAIGHPWTQRHGALFRTNRSSLGLLYRSFTKRIIRLLLQADVDCKELTEKEESAASDFGKSLLLFYLLYSLNCLR